MRPLLILFAVLMPVVAFAQELSLTAPLAEPPAIAAPAPDMPIVDAQAPTPPAAAEDITPEGFYDVAKLQGLNKVTARISELEAPVGTSLRFGNLEIIVKRCWPAPANERPENAAMLEIIDRKPGEAPEVVFNGWMFSSSPSLAGLEHPVYDIVVLQCERRKLGEVN